MNQNDNHIEERTYLDPEVDQYYKQINSSMKGIESPLEGIGSLLLVILITVLLILNINHLQFNR